MTKISITDQRKERFQSVASNRQLDLTILLENVHDPHNIGAVMRTCDAVGIQEIHVLYTEENLNPESFSVGKSSSTGVRKWIDVHFYSDLDDCIKTLRQRYDNLVGTHLSKKASSIYQTDFTESMVVVFGNEHAGITEELVAHLDANVFIPQKGMVQSLNISVACAVTLYETLRQRELSGFYDLDRGFDKEKKELFDRFLEIHGDSKKKS